MITNLVQTAELLITEENGVVFIRRRTQIIWLFALGCAVLSGLVWAWTAGRPTDTAHIMLDKMFGALMAACAGLGVVAAGVTMVRQPIRVDSKRRLLSGAGLPISFEQIQGFRASEVRIGASPWAVLSVLVADKEIRLGSAVSVKWLPALDKVASTLSGILGDRSQAFPEPMDTRIPTEKLVGLIMMVFGLLWAPLGFWLARDVVFRPLGVHPGLLIWPLGLWVGIGGLLTWLGIWVPGRFRAKTRQPRDLVVGVLLMGSYLLLCTR